MTISSETNRVQFAGSGTTGPFTVSTLEIQNNTQVAVTHTDSSGVNTEYVLTTDYTINAALTELTTVANVESGETLTVIIDVALTQGVDYKNTGTFDAEVNEDALDKGILIDKQQTEQLARTIKLKVNSTATDITVEDGVVDKGLKFDASGNLIVTDNDIDTALDAAAASAAAAAISETNAASSASSASSSASAASTAQTNAETAETNAETAQTAAELAETNAETAETNAATSETNAGTSETNAAASEVAAESAASSVAINWAFDSTTTMADPGTGDIRLNNATVSSATAIAVSALTAETGNPDLSDYVATWDDSTSTNNGTITIRKRGTPATFAVFSLTGAVTDNTAWLQLAVTYVDGAGTFSASDDLYVQFIRTGDKGEQGIAGTGALDNVVDDTTPQLGGDLDCNGSQIQWSQGADVASATALVVLTDGNYFDVTGTTAITSINTTGGVGTQIKLHFDGALTLTHHATDLILPGGASITTAAGDEAEFVEYATGDYRCTNYMKADGTAVVAAGGGSWTLLDTQTASASANINFDSSLITSTYKSYVIKVIDATPAIDGEIIGIQVSEDNGSTIKNSSGDYHAAGIRINSGTPSGWFNSTSTYGRFTDLGAGTASGEGYHAEFIVDNPSGSGNWKKFIGTLSAISSAAAQHTVLTTVSYRNTTNAINYIRMLPGNGNIATGTFKLYGIS